MQDELNDQVRGIVSQEFEPLVVSALDWEGTSHTMQIADTLTKRIVKFIEDREQISC